MVSSYVRCALWSFCHTHSVTLILSQGSHLSRRLADLGYRVRIADIASHSYFDEDSRIDSLIGDLREPTFCHRVLRDVDIVIHLAANMGGMGMIHTDNDLVIYRDNHAITLQVLLASTAAGIKTFLYGSSACVYPESLQLADDTRY